MSTPTSWTPDARAPHRVGGRRASDPPASLLAAAGGARRSWVAWGLLGLAVLADPPHHWTDGTTRKERTDV